MCQGPELEWCYSVAENEEQRKRGTEEQRKISERGNDLREESY